MGYESARPVPAGTSNKIGAQYFAKTDPALAVPDLQPVMSHVPLPVVGQEVPAEGHGCSLAPGTIRTLSRGRLWLWSADPGEASALDPRYFEEPYDLRAMVTAVRRAREIGERKALGEWRAREVAPGPGVVTDDEIAAYAKRNLASCHHQVGTCRMGAVPEAVVDPLVRTRGLRVADASVVAAVPSGNTHAPTVVIGERCAEFLISG
ncbi:GMC oxidoreductase [Streptomyces sp. cg40]|uniref:GMC oxidoreductase n=1 Tax=Streptomyces sp. cg40 TaxID=3419764 RepID=UPI003CFC48F2